MSGTRNINNLDGELVAARDIDGNQIARITNSVTTVEALLSSALDDATTHIWWQVIGDNVRVSTDGVNPTTTTGIRLLDGSSSRWSRRLAEDALVVAESGTAVITIFQLQSK